MRRTQTRWRRGNRWVGPAAGVTAGGLALALSAWACSRQLRRKQDRLLLDGIGRQVESARQDVEALMTAVAVLGRERDWPNNLPLVTATADKLLRHAWLMSATAQDISVSSPFWPESATEFARAIKDVMRPLQQLARAGLYASLADMTAQAFDQIVDGIVGQQDEPTQAIVREAREQWPDAMEIVRQRLAEQLAEHAREVQRLWGELSGLVSPIEP